jgi:hypothetical protein
MLKTCKDNLIWSKCQTKRYFSPFSLTNQYRQIRFSSSFDVIHLDYDHADILIFLRWRAYLSDVPVAWEE